MEKMAKEMEKEKKEKVKKAEKESQNRVRISPKQKKAVGTDSNVQGTIDLEARREKMLRLRKTKTDGWRIRKAEEG